eukprot:XP_016660380.1 PREDICTED: uncharacterized protein LOC107883914 [Acyrthosiphon pisum]
MTSLNINVITKDYTSQSYQMPGSSLGGNPEYPSTWFTTNPGSKPKVLIPELGGTAEERSNIFGNALANTVSPGVALHFLHDYILANFKATVSGRWESYGTLIAPDKEEVTPLSVLDVVRGPPPSDNTHGDVLDANGKKRLFYILLAGYRYGLAMEITQGDYKSTVLGKINQVLKNEPFNLGSDLTPTEVGRCKSWYANQELRALIAACDKVLLV